MTQGIDINKVESLKKKYLYIFEQVNLLKMGTNEEFINYLNKFDQYSDDQIKKLEEWRNKEIKFSEDEKENSIQCSNSDYEYYENMIGVRYKQYLRFRVDMLKKSFPECYDYFASQNPTIFSIISKVDSFTEGVNLPPNIQDTKPKLTQQEISDDIEKSKLRKFQANREAITVNQKTYRIGDIVSLNIDPDVKAHIIFVHPKVVLAIDGQTVTLTQKKFIELVL
ncbi:hypothetical protein TVAG_263750 [Trichomonas vaginalis G3]|uniref:Uncharacterized protein n=1 Tax=Trichomonas vaginalis (strain ATCC PRA-98 / G3) TaxID=412133 RepID=A2EP02_TRIV3|nr:hypothetical protein TVAGG3_0945500 [Trichomonas vaginalis G3]EAY05606.1 hypothetical protein TVAG_263750 [Trichomonas vaginalis G3]KAI5486846.1 hypothetical protein TVAGG3_0945500 [Trichomonas vaginalis G3]|eukprot:XP_001317829.1 hypothetical protein [Trichomonas vaginalis G3]